MNKLELQKMAVEVRKGIVTGVHIPWLWLCPCG